MYSDYLKEIPSIRGEEWKNKIHKDFDGLDRTGRAEYLMDAFCIPRSASDNWMAAEGDRSLDQILAGTVTHCILCGEGSALRADKDSGKVDGVTYPVLGDYLRTAPDYAGFLTIQKFLMEMENRGKNSFAIRMNGSETVDLLSIMEMYDWHLESVGELEVKENIQNKDETIMAAIVRHDAA